MYLLEKPFDVITKPFLYFTIENALPDVVANELLSTYFCRDNRLWRSFIQTQIDYLDDTIALLDAKFGLPTQPLIYEINFPHYRPNGGQIIRDWHIDGEQKKYQIIYYLGRPDPAGHTQLTDQDGKYVETLCFKHNRLLVFHSDRHKTPSWHRFFGTVSNDRLTFNMPLVYKS